ncbi:MAG: low specificity L-threonine aldolase [Bacteroidales bacterium]|nr:low specificity L-threonine aldolase [Bacteroidales bacterium]
MNNRRGFASDNNASVHPEVMLAMAECNTGHTVGYGDDRYTKDAEEKIRAEFGQDTECYFMLTGTGANVVGLRSVTQSFNSIICSETAHIEEDECGAPELFTGCKLIPVPQLNGKITKESIAPHLKGFDFEHHSQPKVVSITQATELGAVYQPEEIKELADYVHSYGLLLHMDGARIANAAVSLGLPLRAITRDVGVDLLSFGATKNGAMYGEAILFFTPGLTKYFKYLRKQSMQLASKMRYISVQFDALLSNDLWQRNASHANAMAGLLAEKVAKLPGVSLSGPVESNGVFARIPKKVIEPLQKAYFFYVWDEPISEVRWMTSWDTTEEDVNGFVETLAALMR